MEQVAQRGCECPPFGSIQGQAAWGFEQPGLVGGVPAYSRGLELDDLKGPYQHKLFYDTIISGAVPSTFINYYHISSLVL